MEALSTNMADETVNEEVREGKTRDKSGMSGKKPILFIVLLLLIVIVGGAGAYFTGILDSFLGKEAAKYEEAAEELIPANAPAVFYDVPELLINLNSSGNKNHFLKITISLELGVQDDIPAVEAIMPRIVDNFQVYLRELRVEDLSGSAGIQRLREELLFRVNAAVAPVKVKDVLFQEMLVQ